VKKSQIHILIVLMSLALAGSIGLQVYWIRKAIALSEAQFATSVNDALSQVARRLEQREFNVFFIQAAEDLEIIDLKGPVTHSKTDEGLLTEHNITVKIKSRSSDEKFIQLRKVSTGTDSLDIRQIETIDVRKGPPSQPGHDSTEQKAIRREMIVINTDTLLPGQQGRKSFEWNDKYLDAFEKTLVEIHARGERIEDRIDSLTVDSLIQQALRDQGLSQEYEFWVEAKSGEEETRLVFQTGNREDRELQDTRYRVQLFPDQELAGKSFLHAYFPRQHLYTMRSVWWMAAASVLFTSILLVCFVLTIRTIFRQKRLSEMKNDFINNMTHELKTPLATISLAADALRSLREQWNPGQVDRYTGIIKEENQRMNRQVERVLQAAQFDRREISLHFEPVNMHELIHSAMHPFQLRIEERQGELIAALDAADASVKGDKVHLTHVLHNLLDNAEKYSPESPQIHIATADEGPYLAVRVSDRGCGIRKADQAYIFDRFYRVAAGDLHEVKGFGLGLSYVKEIVTAHGGEISVSSKPGVGSTFTLRLLRTLTDNKP
jgi:two-component system, OmpR family, phosphate regulon sensor histidine kinase PhoR